MRFDDLVRDIRHTVRGLRRTPGFTLAVVLTLALGVGGNTAIFSVVDQVLLRPLPYPQGDRLVRIYERNLNARNPDARYSNGVSPANWLDWQARSKTLSTIGIWFTVTRTLTGYGEPQQLNAQFVSWEFFQTLGVTPLLGRTLTADDDRPAAPNAPRVALLSYGLWERRFAANRDIVGRVIQLDDAPFTVVGVMPRGFRFIQQDIDFWSPFGLNRDLPWRDVAGRFIDVVARIAPNATFASADAEMRSIAADLAATYPMNKDHSVTLVPLREEFTGEVQRSLVVLYAAVGVLLAIACFNVANLLLARSAARRREIAVRTALGAGRVPIVRQLLVESLLLAVGGGLLGLALARWSLDALLAFSPPGLLSVSELTIDQRVLLYALGLSVLTGVVVGLMPAVSLVRRSVLAHLHQSGHRVTQSARLRQSLVVAQVAMTIVLLCAAGLLVRTVIALNGASGGIDRSNLLTMEVTLPNTRYTGERISGFVRQALDAIRSLPGVESAGAGNSLPIIGAPRGGTGFHRLGTPEVPRNRLPSTTVRVVTPGYFRTLRIPIVRGREFTDSDPANGFIVNEAFARAYLQDVDPLATSIMVRMQQENPYLPIVGVVGDVPSGSVRGQATPTVYYSQRQMPQQGLSYLIRTTQPEALSRRAVEALHGIDPNLAVTFVRTFENAMSESIARERLNALVSTAFGLSGLLLAALGLYGLLAFLVTERTKEIGIRISLGAPLARVTASVVGSGLRLAAIGACVGVGASLLIGRWLESLLFGVKPYDATTYLVALGLISLVAGVASYVPARRAAGVEPLAALRQE
jgi:putative ABC transport system permease protein